MDTLEKRDAAMAEAQRLMAVAKPLKEKTEATLARGGVVSDSRWRRLERLAAQMQAALNLSHRYHSEWQKENENK